MLVNHFSKWDAQRVKRSGLLPILLITHENEESGCCEKAIVSWSLLFQQRPTEECFYLH